VEGSLKGMGPTGAEMSESQDRGGCYGGRVGFSVGEKESVLGGLLSGSVEKADSELGKRSGVVSGLLWVGFSSIWAQEGR